MQQPVAPAVRPYKRACICVASTLVEADDEAVSAVTGGMVVVSTVYSGSWRVWFVLWVSCQSDHQPHRFPWQPVACQASREAHMYVWLGDVC